MMPTATTRALVAHLAALLANERAALADFIAALADFDQERRWQELGYASLYDFLVRELGMSKGTAYYRKVAVGLVQRFPEVLEPLRDGRLCITAVHALSKVITPVNRAELLPRFFHVSMQEAKAIAAEIAPAVEVPRRDVVTTVRAAAAPAAAAALDVGHVPNRLGSVTAGILALAPLSPPGPAAPLPVRASVAPLTAEDRRLHLTVSPEFLDMLDACKKALSHVMPGADAAAVLAEGMKLVLARDAKRKALVARPRPSGAAQGHHFATRYVPAELRREVWRRDQGRCQWPLEGGGICGSEFQPEIDHIHGFAPGQPVTAKDLRILCDAHNDLHAREVHGDALMDRFRRRGRHEGAARPRRTAMNG